ncbi:MAG: inositol monophosphatase [Acidimicrobiales bacterium]|nr:inositol monophosphatase [Acidimicrobiia bacterium]NNC78702.1 inositol monophosphatase [Acidimicrobiales bacterium]RZV43429.1 MAG: inositol monophosphatase [Acidimicrobiales bacterium]
MIVGPAQQLAYVAADVARLAAAFVRESVGAAAAASTKSTPTDVVTHTDFESERLIRHELMVRCPGSTIVGEEFDDLAGKNSVGWIVDPIDGTVNFLYDLPVVSVSIAATINGQVVAGAVADILRGEVFDATLGGGARRDGEAISASSVSELGQSLVGTGFSYESTVRARQADRLVHLLPQCRDIRCMGSAALNLCWVGCGRLDAYFEKDLKPYDYAAGALIAAEARAMVDLPERNGEQFTIAAAPAIYDQLRGLVA